MSELLHTYFHTDDGWIHIIVYDEEGEHEYFTPCPHCSPSYLTYRPEITSRQLCWNAHSELCEKCFEPECDFAKGSHFKEKCEK